jgi:endogenous inhibitor of DNA gyrase (YacG/DUF329 family)
VSDLTDQPRRVDCPTCGKAVAWEAKSRWRPFCSERCKLIDLGEWLTENHRIPDDDTDIGGKTDDY